MILSKYFQFQLQHPKNIYMCLERRNHDSLSEQGKANVNQNQTFTSTSQFSEPIFFTFLLPKHRFYLFTPKQISFNV